MARRAVKPEAIDGTAGAASADNAPHADGIARFHNDCRGAWVSTAKTEAPALVHSIRVRRTCVDGALQDLSGADLDTIVAYPKRVREDAVASAD